MRSLRYFAQKYVEWVVRLGKLKFSLLGVCVLAIFALCTQIVISLSIIGRIYWDDIVRSIVFGLISAPFVIYFFTLLVEKLEKSRLDLAKLVGNLRKEVSERVVAERKLSVALSDLEKNHRDKTALMATISHELRTPLNGIIGLSQILLDGQLSEQQRNYLKTINVSAISLGHIFSDIIDLQKIDAQSIKLNLKEVDVYSFLNDITNFATLLAEQKRLHFDFHFAENLPHWLMLDRARLSQVLWNLINNAVKFTHKGRIRLDVKRISETEYAFSISDTGIGIPAEELDNIFKMYYQVKSSEHKSGGSGIGLAVSKTIAQLMGGDLKAYSEYGNGSTFTLTIRAEEVNKPYDTQASGPQAMTILLVEDIEVNVIVAKSLLEKLGHNVDVAMTGKEAIQKFEQNYYDLILLDIQLPDMSGFDIAAHLRRNYEEGVYDFLPPLVAFTANVMQDKSEYLQKGMDDVLRKPISLDELAQCFSSHFDETLTLDVPLPEPETADDDVVEYAMIKELVDILGGEFVYKNLMLFKETMPSYLAELSQAYQIYQQDHQAHQEVASIAHKIKGAAASVGLKHLQKVASEAQNSELPKWEVHIDEWVNELTQSWLHDVDELATWLNKIGK
ncbi:MAG: ATP-binding protein [[Pasteurella] mairii]|uniref:Aerobic respiration control sensor protein n=1 Tax=[Pasteurella] mairii TaxID=757 RepID=A0A379B615_9PAST|nr:ATP-binding protein [[Pasteurella] mairii]SUB34017.1 sensor histidine kinase-like protein [[Pasteurella] mairii]